MSPTLQVEMEYIEKRLSCDAAPLPDAGSLDRSVLGWLTGMPLRRACRRGGAGASVKGADRTPSPNFLSRTRDAIHVLAGVVHRPLESDGSLRWLKGFLQAIRIPLSCNAVELACALTRLADFRVYLLVLRLPALG